MMRYQNLIHATKRIFLICVFRLENWLQVSRTLSVLVHPVVFLAVLKKMFLGQTKHVFAKHLRDLLTLMSSSYPLFYYLQKCYFNGLVILSLYDPMLILIYFFRSVFFNNLFFK